MQRKSRPAEVMARELAEEGDNKLYRRKEYPEIAAEVKAQVITDAVSEQRQNLKKAWKNGRVKLNDADQVKEAIDEYMRACEMSATVPSLLGLAASMGLSRQRIYAYVQAHPDEETATAIDSFRSAAGAILAQGSLLRTLDAPTSIFLLKNSGQNLADKQELDVSAKPYTSTNPDIQRYEIYLTERNVDYSGMDDIAKQEKYLELRYGGEKEFAEHIKHYTDMDSEEN